MHVQWLSLPRIDVRWLQSVAASRPTVFTAHHALPRDDGAGVDARRRVYDIVERVIVHSRRGVDELAALGVDARAHRVHPARGVRGGRRATEPTPPSGSTLLFFGLLRAYKGIDVLVARARAHARTRGSSSRAIRSIPSSRCSSSRASSEWTTRIEWRLGFLPDDEVAALMRDAALVVLPYRRTDASGVLATAIGHGRPAVVTDVGSLGETVRDFGARRGRAARRRARARRRVHPPPRAGAAAPRPSTARARRGRR